MEEKPFANGFVSAYREVLGEILQTDWSECPADFAVIEQVVLARNQAQHGENITSFDTKHYSKTLSRFRKPLFASDDEYRLWVDGGGAPNSYLAPRVQVSAEALMAAIEHIEKLADYIENRLDKAWEWRRDAARRLRTR